MTRDRYQRIDVLARGGMGTVELVARRDGRFRRLYARKRLLPVHREDADLRSMFLDEARVAGLLRHPNVVSVLDVGEDDEGPYLVMDLVEGVALSKLAASVAERGPLPVAVCLDLARQVAEGLAAAHALRSPQGEPLGLIHRDLSPSNVLVGFDGLARITDFGIAKASGQSVRTSTGVLKGKPAYMAPEQLRFEEIDQRADLFTFGVLLYELLAGDRLYGGGGADLPAVARRVLHEPPPDLTEARPEVPDALTELLFELLAKQPDDRPADAVEVVERLRLLEEDVRFDGDAPTVAQVLERRFGEARRVQRERFDAALSQPPPTPTLAEPEPELELEPETRPLARSRWVLAGAGLVALLGLAVAGTWALGDGPEPAPDRAPPPLSRAPAAPDAGPPATAEREPDPPEPEASEPEASAPEPAAEPTSRRRRRRPVQRPAEPQEPHGVRTWSWQER